MLAVLRTTCAGKFQAGYVYDVGQTISLVDLYLGVLPLVVFCVKCATRYIDSSRNRHLLFLLIYHFHSLYQDENMLFFTYFR